MKEVKPWALQYTQNVGELIGQQNIQISNNNENLVGSYCTHTTTRKGLEAAFRAACYCEENAKHYRAYTNSLTCLSSFLQTPIWPYCQKRNRKCSPPNVIHRPDVAIMFKELPQNPPGDHTPFRVPIMLVEIEGDGGTWGEGEWESKALEEACISLAFIPHVPLIIVYPTRWEIWWISRDPQNGRIVMAMKPYYLQCKGEELRGVLHQLTEHIVQLLAKQLTTATAILRKMFSILRQKVLTTQLQIGLISIGAMLYVITAGC